MWETWPAEGDVVITAPDRWVFDGAGLKAGDHLTGLLGYEVDRMWNHSPEGTYRIARSPYDYYGETRYSDMTVYHHAVRRHGSRRGNDAMELGAVERADCRDFV